MHAAECDSHWLVMVGKLILALPFNRCLVIPIVESVNEMDVYVINPLTPNDPYSGRTAPLTSKHCILYIYSTNSGTEYFKHGIYSPFFSLPMQFVS